MTVTDYKKEIIAYFERKVKDMEMNKDSHSRRGINNGIGYQYDGIRKALDNTRTFQGVIISGDQAREIDGIGPKLAQEIQDLIDSL